MTTVLTTTSTFQSPSAASDVTVSKTPPPRWLTASPYLEEAHLLDLDTVDTQSRMLAQALTDLKVATEEYATVEYEKALDFSAVTSRLRSIAALEGVTWVQQDFYVVDFRSKLKSQYDKDLLFMLDKKSHQEAMQSGGLLKYWFGEPNAERRNLATCEFTVGRLFNETDSIRHLAQQGRRYQRWFRAVA